WANVSSRSFCAGGWLSGIHILVHFIDGRIRRRDGELDCLLHLGFKLSLHLREDRGIGEVLLDQPLPKIHDRIPLRLPGLFFLFGSVIFAVDVAHVMSVIAIGIAQQECGTVTAASAIHQRLHVSVNRAHILTVHAGSLQTKGGCPRENVSGGGFRVMRVFVVEIVLADVDHRQLEELGEVHLFIENSLAERAFSEKTYRHLAGTETAGRKCGPRGNAAAAAYDCIRSQVAGGRVRNVHGTAFALAVSGLLAQQFGKHSIGRGAFRQTMSVTAMGAGDVVGRLERFTNAHGNRLLTDIKVRQAGHQRSRVKLVHLRFKLADGNHLPVHAEPQIDFFRSFLRLGSSCHLATPDMRAKTSKITAKSSFSQPIPRAAVRNSLLMAVVGTGTFNLRPNSMARSISFCIMLTSNHATSGCCNTKGPRYTIMGEAIALWIITSTATSRAMPLFSASSTPSQNASICTANCRFTAIFIDNATPLSPTWVTFGPMSRSNGFRGSKVSLRPPTITESLPCCNVMTLPETGASIMSAPFSRTFAASARLTSGLTVLMSMWNLPAEIPASNPCGPSVTAASAAALVTMVKVTSDATATAWGESANFMPLSINHCALERVRLKP